MKKITKDYKGDFHKITDLCRGAISTTSKDPCNFAALSNAYKSISGTVKFVKNKFAEVGQYADINSIFEVDYGKGKQLCEVQFHLKDFMDTKNGADHKVYEKRQEYSRAAEDVEPGSRKQKLNTAKAHMAKIVGASFYPRVW